MDVHAHNSDYGLPRGQPMVPLDPSGPDDSNGVQQVNIWTQTHRENREKPNTFAYERTLREHFCLLLSSTNQEMVKIGIIGTA
jgi:hypothetical protein